MENMSILDHGLSVWSYTEKILNKNLEDFRIPEWLTENYEFILSNIHEIETIKNYNIFHDCGKPYCETLVDGRKQFPNHAEVSKTVWMENNTDRTIGNLIGWDMVLHTETADEIKARNFNIKDGLTLLITALAEIHSNAQMFGGVESNSFKSKWKKLNRRGKMLIKEYS
tara:strand:+ start:1505 stop:2011 length:507 start_codon:yes stop_codon:yes gene_type:complete